VIDGHKRIAALQQLGRDTVEATGLADERSRSSAAVSVAAKKCTILAGRNGARGVVTLWARQAPRKDEAACSRELIVRRFHLWGAVGLAFDLKDDGAFDQPIGEGHSQQAVRQILSPLVEIHVGNQRRGALIIGQLEFQPDDHLVVFSIQRDQGEGVLHGGCGDERVENVKSM